MENQTPFDLNAAIGRWRRELSNAPGFQADDLDELESHVRDSAETLQGQGLSGEEAFLIAVRRTGGSDALAAEFAAINRSAVWLDRLVWMTTGWISISALLSVGTLLSVRRPAVFVAPVLSSVVLALALIVGLNSLLPKHFRTSIAWAAGSLLVLAFVRLVFWSGSVSDSLEGFSYLMYNTAFFVQCLATASLIVLVTFMRRKRSPA